MHFLTIDKLKPNMILGRDIISSNRDHMLVKGVKLTDAYIDYMKTKGYLGAYISEPGTEDICPVEPVKPETFMESVEAVEKANIGKILTVSAKVVAEVSALELLSIDLLDLRSYDDYTYHHSVNVAVYSVAVGKYMGLSDKDLLLLCQAGLCHDLGKSKISLDIINKAGKLTEAEYEEIKKHPRYSYDILHDNPDVSAIVRQAVLFHHENENGTGYPMGKSEADIPLFAKIIHAVDVFDALTTRRPYKEPYSSSMAIDYLHGGKDILFDRRIIDAIDNIIPLYPPGMDVTLSNDEVAVVVSHSNNPQRPVVRILDSRVTVDLSKSEAYRDVFIVKANILPQDYTSAIEKFNETKRDTELAKKKLMIVDDSSLSIMQAKAAFSENEYEISTYQSALEVINAIHDNGAPDLLLADIDMPVMNGINLVNSLNKNGTLTFPVIFLTSICNRETVLKCHECGAVDYILKPANHTYLRERVKYALDGQEQL